MSTLNILSQSELITEMKNYIIANQDNITDFNSGSGLDTQINAFATQVNQAFVKCSGGFKSQFEAIPFSVFNFQRKDSESASGTVVFSRQNADPSEITIPAGTKVGTSGGLLYTTQDEVLILSGATDSGAANIIADEPGEDYNQFIGIINQINSSVDGVNSVTNNTAATGGKDKESNTAYFTRFTNFVLGLSKGNRYGVFTGAVSVDTIQSGFVQDHFPPESGLYNFTVYVDDGSGSVPQEKLDEVYLELYGNDTSVFQGYVSAGINFRVLSAGLVNVAVAYTIKIDPTLTDASTITVLANDAITNYINNLWVGSDVIRSELIRLIKGINGVLDVEVLTLNGNPDNIETQASQVPRVSSITSTVTS